MCVHELLQAARPALKKGSNWLSDGYSLCGTARPASAEPMGAASMGQDASEQLTVCVCHHVFVRVGYQWPCRHAALIRNELCMSIGICASFSCCARTRTCCAASRTSNACTCQRVHACSPQDWTRAVGAHGQLHGFRPLQVPKVRLREGHPEAPQNMCVPPPPAAGTQCTGPWPMLLLCWLRSSHLIMQLIGFRCFMNSWLYAAVTPVGAMCCICNSCMMF